MFVLRCHLEDVAFIDVLRCLLDMRLGARDCGELKMYVFLFGVAYVFVS